MRAVVIESSELILRERPLPVPGKGEVRVRVRATAVNRADLIQVRGAYPAPPDAPADIPGLEFAGEIDEVGEGVSHLAVGDRVFGLAGGGTYAEAVVVHGATLARLPGGLSFLEAAALPEAFITAYDAMVVQAGLSAGEVALVHAVGSGVGSAAVQIARAVGATCVGTARAEDKLARARELGMDHGVLVRDTRFAAGVLEASSGRGADVVLDLVGGPYLPESVACAAPKGRIMLVGLLGGTRTEVDLGAILRRRLVLRGTVLRTRPLEEKIQAGKLLERNLGPLFARGALRPVIHRVFPLARAAEAHALLAENSGFGKLVLDCD